MNGVNGVSTRGERDILGTWAGDGGEGAKYWLNVLTEIKNRSVVDVCISACDGLKGLPEAITTVSRLTSGSGAGSMTYNSHGDATTVGTQSFTYDSSDRVIGGSAGATSQSVAYTLDVADRSVGRVGSGTGAGMDVSTSVYSCTGSGDTADIQLTATRTIGERYVALAGGVLLTKRYAATGGDLWAFSNIHGDTLATTDRAGNLNALPAIYDPYGNPLATTTGVVDLTADPTTRTNGLTDGWEGSHQRGAEHTGNANWILMGARVYLPGVGQFTSTDPVFGGNVNPYTYPADPINNADLTGMFTAPKWLRNARHSVASGVKKAVKGAWEHRDQIALVLGVIGMFACSLCVAALWVGMAITAVSTGYACANHRNASCAMGVASLATGGLGKGLQVAGKGFRAAGEARIAASGFHPIQNFLTGPLIKGVGDATWNTGYASGWASVGVSGAGLFVH